MRNIIFILFATSILFTSCTSMERVDSEIVVEPTTEKTNLDSGIYNKALADSNEYNQHLVYADNGDVYVFEMDENCEIKHTHTLTGEADKEVADWGLFIMFIIAVWVLFKD